MKSKIFTSFLLVITSIITNCFGQITETITEDATQVETAQEEIPHYLRKENFTVVRLIITNSKNQILMAGGDGWWGMPWVNLTKRQFLNEAIDSLATEYGIQLSDVELRGQFCFKYDYKPTVTFRNYYVAKYESGEIKIPRNTIEDEFMKVEWVDIEESIKRNGNDGIEQITKHILDNPNYIWGASFMVSHTENDHPTKMVEDFYQLAQLKGNN